MKLSNSIGWCDATTNAVTGCDKISPGCKNCYAATGTRARVLRALGIETWGPKGVRHPVAEMSAKLRRLNKLCLCDTCHATAPFETHLGKRCPHCADAASDQKLEVRPPASAPFAISAVKNIFRRIRFFADSNSDWLDEKWPTGTLANFLNEIRQAPNIDILLLTKRPENFDNRLLRASDYLWAVRGDTELERLFIQQWGSRVSIPKHIWLGTSVENQKYADERIPALLQIPAAVHFLSCEPLLEPVDLTFCLPWQPEIEARKVSSPILKSQILRRTTLSGIDWVIVGGESGTDRRDCHVEPIVNIVEQCKSAGVPVYVKQDSAFKSGQQGKIPDNIWKLKQFPSALSASFAVKNLRQSGPLCG